METTNTPPAVVIDESNEANERRIVEDWALQIPSPEENVSAASLDEETIRETTEIIDSYNALTTEDHGHQVPFPKENVPSPSTDIYDSDTGIIEVQNQREENRNSQSVITHENDSKHKEAQKKKEEPEPVPSTSFAEYRQVREQLSADTQQFKYLTPTTQSPFPSPRTEKVTTDLLGHPRFQRIVPYVWPQDRNMRYISVPNRETNLGYNYVPNMGNIRHYDIPNMETNLEYYNVSTTVNNMGYNYVLNSETAYYEHFQQYEGYEDPNNIQYMQNNNIPYSPICHNNMNVTYEQSEYLEFKPIDQNTMHHVYIPGGPEPYYPYVNNNEAVYIQQPEYAVPPLVVAPQRYAEQIDASGQYNPGLLPVYTQMLNGQMQICSPSRAQREMNKISELNRQDSRRPTIPDNNLDTINSSPRPQNRNTRSRLDQHLNGSQRQNLDYPHLLDEEEIYLLETMELPETYHKNRGSRREGLELTDTGSQAMNYEDYLLIENISTIRPNKFKSCTDLLRYKSAKEDTSDKPKESTVNTKSIGILTESKSSKTIITQTDILDNQIPFKIIIPTKYLVQEPPRTSFMECKSSEPILIKKSAKFTKLPKEIDNSIKTLSEEIKLPEPKITQKIVALTDTTLTSPEEIEPPKQKSVRFTDPIIIPVEKLPPAKPQRIKKSVSFVKAKQIESSSEVQHCPKSILIKKSITALENVKSPQEKSENHEPQVIIKAGESTCDSCKLSDRTTNTTTETLGEKFTDQVPSTSQTALEPKPPQTVIIPKEEDDGIPMMPRRRNRKLGEPAHVSYAEVVLAGRKPSPEIVNLKRTENLKRMAEVHTVKVDIPPSTTKVPMSYADAASRKVARKQSVTPQPTSHQSRPIAPIHRTTTNWVVLELTLERQLMPNSLQYTFNYFINRGMRYKILSKQIVLLIFREQRDAKEVLQSPCLLGTIVAINNASERSKQVASTYCNSVGRRHNTPSRFSQSEYKK